MAVADRERDLAHVGVVGGGEAREPDLLVAGRREDRVRRLDRHGGGPLAERPELHPRLAEAAAAGAAAHDLDLRAVEDDG
ncbi:MAG: hypothetical protein MUE82_13385, partial [Chloroflexi bacterium]|nr:hypothetical protein [Chloroflexota bacterium]